MKKQERLENKKRKVAALVDLMEINEADKKSKLASENDNDSDFKEKIDAVRCHFGNFCSNPSSFRF